MITIAHVERLTGQRKPIAYEKFLDLLEQDGYQILPTTAGFAADIEKVFDIKTPPANISPSPDRR